MLQVVLKNWNCNAKTDTHWEKTEGKTGADLSEQKHWLVNSKKIRNVSNITIKCWKHDGHIKKYHRNTFVNKTLHTYTVANLY